MPHGVPFSANAAHVHGAGARGSLPHPRHHAPAAADSRQLREDDLPAQSRRAHARDGDRFGGRLSVADLRHRPARQAQSRHPSPPGAAAGARPPPHRADEQPVVLDARRTGHLLWRRAWHGRQHPAGRSRRRAHAHAVGARPPPRPRPPGSRRGALPPPMGELTYLLTLAPFGFSCFILPSESASPSWHTPAPEPMPDYVTVVLRNHLDEALEAAAPILERETLSPYLLKRRWFGAKDQALQSSRMAYLAPLVGDRGMLLAEVEVKTGSTTSRWQLPLSMCWEDEPMAALPSQLALARVRRGRRVGLLTAAFSLAGLSRQMLAALANGGDIDTPEGQIVFETTPDHDEVLRRPAAP